MNKLYKLALFLTFALSLNFIQSHSLEKAVSSNDRSINNTLRDGSRHPYETLTFFGIESDMTVVELSPGGGWYTEILANYIHYPGTLIAAHFNPEAGDYYAKSRNRFENKMNSNPIYGRVELVNLDSNLAEPNSVDAVITFRNLHNWLGSQMDLIFTNSYKALKPEGIFGIVEHRAYPGTNIETMKKSGYVTEELAIQIAERHGFKFIGKSEINANPRDTKDHPKGVWTLPPSLRLKEKDSNKYKAIGESDRMTLLFKK